MLATGGNSGRLSSSSGGNREYGTGNRADFAHKVSVAAKEIRESRYWLHLVHEANLTPTKPMEELIREASELIRILMASAKTARAS
jgi:four helix bundle protein